MKSFGPRAFALACLAVSTLSGVSLAAAAETLLIGGTGGALGTMQRLINAYRLRHPERRVALVSASLGTGGAMRALADGRLGIALAGRALTEREQAFGFRAFPYARTPLAFVAQDHQ